MQQLSHVCIGILAQDIEQLDKVADDLTRRQMRIGSHAAKLNLEEVHQVVLGKRGRPAKVAGMDLHEFFDQHQQLLIGEWLQADDGREHVLKVLACKATLSEPAAQSLVGEYAATAVLDGGRRAAHDHAQVLRLALERVVVHGEDFLVVVLARDGVGNLVQIHEFVDEHQHALVAAADQKARNELNVVVPVVIADDGRGAQLGACLTLGAVLAANPFGHATHSFFVALRDSRAITAEHAGEVEAVDHLLERGQLGINDRLVDVGKRGDPAIQNKVERTALGARLGRYIADELAVGGEALSLTALQTALGRQVGIGDHKALAHGMRSDGLKQEALAGAVATD